MASDRYEQYLRHAKLRGTYQVFESAYDDHRLTLLELGELVQELRKIQRTPKQHWEGGVPLVFSHRTKKFNQPGPKSPDGILGDLANRLIGQMLTEGFQHTKIVQLLGVTPEKVRFVADELDQQEA